MTIRRDWALLFLLGLTAGCGGGSSNDSETAPSQSQHAKKVPKKTTVPVAPDAAQGIMVGNVTETTALLQVRLTRGTNLVDGDVPGATGYAKFVLRRVGENAQPRERIGIARPENDYIVRVQYRDLTPGSTYQCQVTLGGVGTDKSKKTPILDAKSSKPGPAATFKTLQGDATAHPASFVVVTGMNYAKFHGDGRINKATHKKLNNRALPRPYSGPDKHLGYPALESILKLKPDFFVGTGDNVYYDTPRKPRAKTITQMRRKWHEQFVQPRYRDMFAAVPTYWEIDDHDYRIDDGDNTGDHEPSVKLAQRVMKEQLPYGLLNDPNVKTYRTRRVNQDLQVWFVENRMYRSPNKMEDGPKKSIWGKEQREWLQETLAKSTAKFKVLVSPNPMIGPDDARKSDNHTNFGGFRAERDAFFKWLIDSGLHKKHFYLVCGDRHWQYHSIHPLGMEEFSCGALVDANSRLGRSPGDPKSTDPDAKIKQVYAQKEPSGGFLHVAVKPADESSKRPAMLTFAFHDERGKVLYTHTKK